MADPIATVLGAQQMLKDRLATYEECCEAADALDTVVEEIDQLRADAKRYRWLRNHAPYQWYADQLIDAVTGDTDAAIDAARDKEAQR